MPRAQLDCYRVNDPIICFDGDVSLLTFFVHLDHVCYEITADNVRQYIIVGMLYNNNSIIPIVGGLSSVNKKLGCREWQ